LALNLKGVAQRLGEFGIRRFSFALNNGMFRGQMASRIEEQNGIRWTGMPAWK
jgi:hypothetical protein